MINNKHIKYLSEINHDTYSDSYTLINADTEEQDVYLFVSYFKPVTYVIIDLVSHIIYKKDRINYVQEI